MNIKSIIYEPRYNRFTVNFPRERATDLFPVKRILQGPSINRFDLKAKGETDESWLYQLIWEGDRSTYLTRLNWTKIQWISLRDLLQNKLKIAFDECCRTVAETKKIIESFQWTAQPEAYLNADYDDDFDECSEENEINGKLEETVSEAHSFMQNQQNVAYDSEVQERECEILAEIVENTPESGNEQRFIHQTYLEIINEIENLRKK